MLTNKQSETIEWNLEKMDIILDWHAPKYQHKVRQFCYPWISTFGIENYAYRGHMLFS